MKQVLQELIVDNAPTSFDFKHHLSFLRPCVGLAPGRAGVLDELQQLAGDALVIVDRHPPATKRREHRRDDRAERYRELRQWRAVWRKLGVRVVGRGS